MKMTTYKAGDAHLSRTPLDNVSYLDDVRPSTVLSVYGLDEIFIAVAEEIRLGF